MKLWRGWARPLPLLNRCDKSELAAGWAAPHRRIQTGIAVVIIEPEETKVNVNTAQEVNSGRCFKKPAPMN